MRRSLPTALLLLVVAASGAEAQLLDDTLVPRGRVRVQAHPWFGTWNTRYGVASDGTESEEPLGSDLTDPTGLALFPGTDVLVGYVQDVGGLAGYAPTLGPVDGRVQKDVTRIDFGGHLGVFDWLTIGVVVPWVQTRTAIDLNFEPDTVGGAQLGLNPRVISMATVDTYLGALGASADAAVQNATAVCAAGASPECSAAVALADRAFGFQEATEQAYAASNLFPVDGSAAATALALVASGLDADLSAAGLPSVGLPMVFASGPLGAAQLRNLPVTAGAGIDGFSLASRRALWSTGDVEISALVRLLDRPVVQADERTPSGTSYRLTAGLLVRLPTGTPENPDVFLDSGSGDAQTDVEMRLIGRLGVGRLTVSAGGLYGSQGETTVVRRVAPLEVPMPPMATRRELVWRPGSYVGLEVEPGVRLTNELQLVGQLRYYRKNRDEYELLGEPDGVSPYDLAVESGVKLTQLGAGVRYSTVASWRAGHATTPIEAHLRLMYSVAGSGGHTPVMTRVETGLRLYRRFWGR